MSTVIVSEELSVPESVVDLGSFREWVGSADFPKTCRVAFLRGKVWVDVMPERLETHGQVKNEISRVVSNLCKAEDTGRWFPDRVWWTNVRGDISTESDGLFVLWETLESGRVQYVGDPAEAIEIEGSPDVVLEVVSRTSVRKDTVVLLRAYWQAGVREYWLVDARSRQIDFKILRRGPRGFRAVPVRAGWQRSVVFGREFKLDRRPARLGLEEYELSVR